MLRGGDGRASCELLLRRAGLPSYVMLKCGFWSGEAADGGTSSPWTRPSTEKLRRGGARSWARALSEIPTKICKLRCCWKKLCWPAVRFYTFSISEAFSLYFSLTLIHLMFTHLKDNHVFLTVNMLRFPFMRLLCCHGNFFTSIFTKHMLATKARCVYGCMGSCITYLNKRTTNEWISSNWVKSWEIGRTVNRQQERTDDGIIMSPTSSLTRWSLCEPIWGHNGHSFRCLLSMLNILGHQHCV